MKTKKISLLIALFLLQLNNISYAQVNFEWAKSISGTGLEVSYNVKVDASGNVYTTGQFEGTVDFDPGASTSNLTATGNRDIFISKFDMNGNYLWAKKMEGFGDEIGLSLAIDASGALYIGGIFQGTVDFDPSAAVFSLNSNGQYDIFIAKLDAGGNFLWAKSMGGFGIDGFKSLAIDPSGNVCFVGSFEGLVDFDPGSAVSNLTSAGAFDIFVCKLNSAGTFLWAKSVGASSFDGAFSIAIDATSNIYVTGYFNGTADFDPNAGVSNLTSAGGDDLFILKLDNSGNFLWANSSGGISSDWGTAITIDASGNVITTGRFQGTIDFDPSAGVSNLTSVGADKDVFVSKLDASGNFLWAKSVGDAGYDIAYAIATDATGNIYATGTFSGTVDFNPGTGSNPLTSNGIDVFILKLDAAGNFVWANQTGGSGSETVESIAVDALGKVYITGYYVTTVDFDPSPSVFNLTPLGVVDVYILKLGQAGFSGITSNSQTDFSIFPNPAKGTLNIIYNKELKKAEVNITDVLGKSRLINSYNGTSAAIDISTLNKGIYYIQILGDDNFKKIKKLIVE